MRVRQLGLVTALSSLIVAAPAQAQVFNSCDHQREITNRVAVPAGTLLRVKAQAGTLVVRGVQGLQEARIRGDACASSAALLDQLSVAVQRNGQSITIETRFPENNWGNQTARINLVLEVPMGIAADIEDGSGDAELSGLGDVTIDDGSGNLRVTDMRGSVTVEDGSGNVDIRGVVGDVEIHDGSGGVNITDVRGSVRITDGSGGIDVRGVRGDFIVSNDGSGGVNWANVDGRVSVPNRRGRTP